MLGGVCEGPWRRLAASWSLLRASWRRLGWSSSRLRYVLEFRTFFSYSALAALWRLLGASLDLFSESPKRLGSDITLTVHFEGVRSQLRGRFTLILEVKTK